MGDGGDDREVKERKTWIKVGRGEDRETDKEGSKKSKE